MTHLRTLALTILVACVSFAAGTTADPAPATTPDPGQVVAQLYRSTKQTLTGLDLIAYDTAEWDLLGGWDSETPTRYTPTEPGLYRFDAGVGFASELGGWRDIHLRRNGSPVYASHVYGPASLLDYQTRPVVVAMDGVDDYIEVRVRHFHTSAITTSAPWGRPTLVVVYEGPLPE
jgi:hypothetical protein